jgi:outer membrane biosynthesis protein TonB
LAQAAEDAVRQWKFEPAAAASNENIEVSFSLNQ